VAAFAVSALFDHSLDAEPLVVCSRGRGRFWGVLHSAA
jgi:hypothetical protein